VVGRRKGRRQIKRSDFGESLWGEGYRTHQHRRHTTGKGAISHSERSYVQQAPFGSMDIHSGFYQFIYSPSVGLQADRVLCRLDPIAIFDASLLADLIQGFHDDDGFLPGHSLALEFPVPETSTYISSVCHNTTVQRFPHARKHTSRTHQLPKTCPVPESENRNPVPSD